MFLLQNARILTPDNSAARHLLTGGGRILWIGENPADLAAMEKLPELEVIDLEDRWLVPGLVDCHAHITGGDADLVVLDDDLSLWGVMARGQWHRGNHEQLEYGFIEGEEACARHQ